MHPKIHAATHPEKPAVIMAGTGEVISYAELEAQSNRIAHLLRAHGCNVGDTIAFCLENHRWFLALAIAAQRAGLYYVAISSRLTVDEAAYIVIDSGAKLLISSMALLPLADALADAVPAVPQYLFDGGDDPRAIEPFLAQQPTAPIADERCGIDMLYSSGTTGRPKGVRFPLPAEPDILAPNSLLGLAQHFFGFHGDCVYLSPAPLYHAAPLRWCIAVLKLGGTVIVMEKFDPEEALKLIERYKVDVSQWVPTHFVRMLKLPPELRAKYDVSSLKSAVHAAAPCPIPIKEAMINWWGPVINEYYAGSEGNGFTFINSADWLTHKGSVGKALLGIVHICDENGEEVPPGQSGEIFFEGGAAFSYHNDPAKTASATNPQGWTTLGDVGRVDEDGFLYLTDRKSFMIISGGVNIYPQEIENLLITHPKVADAAVIGAPCPDLGERVVAVVQPLDMADAGNALAVELEAYLRTRLSGVKIPRQIDFRAELPRHPTGKLYKRLLRDEYWAKEGAA
ncbi:MAG: acyl-CoA synthetase [Parasphingorhabdus sp.]|nr:acyl-CoA synthetase [Parasphingorhabdus sp.]